MATPASAQDDTDLRTTFYSELAAKSRKTALAVRLYEQAYQHRCQNPIPIADLVERVSSENPDPSYLGILKGVAEDSPDAISSSLKNIRCLGAETEPSRI